VPTVARSASKWEAALSLAFRATVSDTPIKAATESISQRGQLLIETILGR